MPVAIISFSMTISCLSGEVSSAKDLLIYALKNENSDLFQETLQTIQTPTIKLGLIPQSSFCNNPKPLRETLQELCNKHPIRTPHVSMLMATIIHDDQL